MEIFGPAWKEHAKQMELSWTQHIQPEDLVLIPGDISWAMRLEEALADLKWIDHLPGTKLLLKGNHDYWWGSIKKISASLPPSLHLIQNNSFRWKDVAVGGARLWDTPEYQFNDSIDFQENPAVRMVDREVDTQKDLNEEIFLRELQRLEMSLATMPTDVKLRIAMTHYPPIGADLKPSRASQILEKHRIDICVFGHLHNVKKGLSLFGKARNIQYVLASSDYLHFQPKLIHDF